MDTRSAIRTTLFGQWVKFLTQMVGFVVLARLLSPTEFGIIAMVAPVIAFASLFADLGLYLAGIQAKTLTSGQKSLLFYLNTCAGAGCAAAIAGAAPFLAHFYGEPRVLPVALALGGSLLLIGLGVQFRVELTRNGKYGALAAQDSSSALVALIVALVAALLGAGYWALVLQALTQPLVVLIMAIPQSRWLPGRPAHPRNAASFLVFGGHNLVLQLLNLASRSIDAMAIGRVQGAGELGLYSRSSQLISIIFQQVVSPLTRVTLPRLAQAGSQGEFEMLVQRIQRAICYVLVGLLSGVAAVAPAACVVILGDEWRGAGPLVQSLAVGGIFAALGYAYYWALLAKARTGLLVLAELPGRLIMIVGAIFLASFGAQAVAMAIVVGQLVTFVSQVAAGRRVGLSARRMVGTAGVPTFVFLLAAGTAVVAQVTVRSETLQLLIGSSAWALIAAASCLIPSVRRDLSAVMPTLRRRKSSDD